MLDFRIRVAALVAGGLLLAGSLRAQSPTPRLTLQLGIGNGLGLEAGYERGPWLLLGRTRYKWWLPAEYRTGRLFSSANTRSRQTEVAVLLGRTLTAGQRHQFHGAAGLALLAGREIGEYRYSLHQSGLVGSNDDYFSYRRYTALGLPLELGWQVGLDRLNIVRLGVTGQANLNPQRSDFTLLATFAAAIPLSDPR